MPVSQEADCSPRLLLGKPLSIGGWGGEAMWCWDGGGQGGWGSGSGENIFSPANYFP